MSKASRGRHKRPAVLLAHTTCFFTLLSDCRVATAGVGGGQVTFVAMVVRAQVITSPSVVRGSPSGLQFVARQRWHWDRKKGSMLRDAPR